VNSEPGAEPEEVVGLTGGSAETSAGDQSANPDKPQTSAIWRTNLTG